MQDKKTALHIAVEHGDVEFIEVLLAAGAAINLVNNVRAVRWRGVAGRDPAGGWHCMPGMQIGWSALHFATVWGFHQRNVQIVKALLAAGADVNIKDEVTIARSSRVCERPRCVTERGACVTVDVPGGCRADKLRSSLLRVATGSPALWRRCVPQARM